MTLPIVLSLIALAFFFYAATFVIKKLAQRYQIVDVPNQRSSHKDITPRGGGLAIVITWFTGITILFFARQLEENLYYAFLCGALLAIISLLDDVINLSPKIRMITQMVVSIGAFLLLKGINPVMFDGFELDIKFILYPLTIFGMVWFINLYNFLDGIDAYVSIEAIFLAAVFFLFTGSSILLVLMASVLGFLFWNWPKAKIFMGDVGSTQLGFILVVLGIYFHNQNEVSIIYWVLLTSPFWFDATFTLFRRWRNKETLSQAHKKHAYQRFVQAGFSHLKTDSYLMGINIFVFALVWFVREYEYFYLPALALIITFLYLLTKRIDKLKSF